MTATLGVDTRTSVEKSTTKKRKWFFSITWADIIDGVKVWREYPNYISQLFDTKKAATADMKIQLAKFAKIIVNNKFVICKDNHCWENSLTIGKEYSVITETEDTYVEVELHNTVNFELDGLSCVDVYVNGIYVGEMCNESIPDIDDEEEINKFEERLVKFLNENYY